MSKVLRLHTSGVDTIEDWQQSSVYGRDVITQIDDPIGASAKHEITSIPSPFARIDLVKSAFKNIAESKQLDGQTIFHKMVSDSLDVGELFFKAQNYSDRVKIICWDKNEHIAKLKKRGNNILANTLEMYLDQDAAGYNFNDMQRIFILGYVGSKRKTEFDVLGATSPATLFFSIANDLSYVSRELPFNTDYPFDAEYNPLYNRDKEFVKYIFALKNSFVEFAAKFPEVNEYLNLTYARLDSKLKDDVDNATTDNNSVLSTSDGRNIVEIISGLKYHSKSPIPTDYDSDFKIKSTRLPNDNTLVLPCTTGSKYSQMTLTHGRWDGNNPAPYIDTVEVSQRRIPQTYEQIPYLTISDFLEDRIIKMPYKLNSQVFFDANQEVQRASFLLPLKDLFFKYFSAEDVVNDRMIEFRKNTGGVKVVLHIPVKGGKIDYERIYFENNEPKIEGCETTNGKNDGAIVEKKADVAFALMPNIHFTNDSDAKYKFVLSTLDYRTEYNVSFYSPANQIIPNVPSSQRNTSNMDFVANRVFDIEGYNLEFIRVSDEISSGIVLPIMKRQQSNKDFTFAVDFGTSNTHIVYKIDRNQPKAFDIENIDRQIQLNSEDITENISESIYQEVIPEFVGENQLSMFPMRSALLYAGDFDWKTPCFALGQANFAFLYEKKARYDYNKVETDLKWNSKNRPEKEHENVLSCYIESLFFILRNKVLLNNGKLDTVKVFWTYPLAMSISRKNLISGIWNKAYKKYFNSNTSNLYDVNESIAPYHYYSTHCAAINNIATIDIGGGTTDIIIANHGEIKGIASFRFAADSIFGDLEESHAGSLNGIVKQFLKSISDKLKANNLAMLQRILKNLENEGNSANVASFFFSLVNNKELKEKRIEIDFFRELQLDQTQKITFLIFYCAIIYRLAQIMKDKGFDMPRHIGFSGNGAKTVKILTDNAHTLEKLTKRIFEKINGDSAYPNYGLEIILMDNPKEATSIGAVMYNKKDDFEQIKSKIIPDNIGNSQSVTYEYLEKEENRINHVAQIETETMKFLDFVFELNDGKNISFTDDFGIEKSTIEIAREVCNRDIKSYAEIVINKKLREKNNEDRIDDQMLFYPMPGILHALMDAIYKHTLKNPENNN